MSDEKSDLQPVVPSLKGAMRRARLEEAERSDVLAELRGAELARLEMLAEALEPVYAQLPDDIDIFDAGVIPGERPRLFVDMIGFVEMRSDKRTYRFVQDTRHGRVVIKESDRTDTMVSTITDYVGRRLLERERAMASDQTIENAAQNLASTQTAPVTANAATSNSTKSNAAEPSMLAAGGAAKPAEAQASTLDNTAKDAKQSGKAQPASAARKSAPVDTLASEATEPRRGALAWLWDTIEFFALFIGFVVLLTAIAGAIYFFWTVGDLGLITKFFKSAG